MVLKASCQALSRISTQPGHSHETLPHTAAGHDAVVEQPLPLLPSSEEGPSKNSAEQCSIQTCLTAPGEDIGRSCWGLNIVQTQTVRALPKERQVEEQGLKPFEWVRAQYPSGDCPTT